MSDIPDNFSKKILPPKIRHKRSSIPININMEYNRGKFLFSKKNKSKVSSSYFSIGEKIKSIPKIYENTNSISIHNSRLINASSCLLNNPKSNNKNDICYINDKTNNNNTLNYSQNKKQKVTKIEKHKIKYSKRIIYSKKKRQLSTTTNSNISSELLITGYKTSLNNKNNSKIKNKAHNNSSISKNNNSKIEHNYSSRSNHLDSRNKTKKRSTKLRLRLYKFNKPISISFPIALTTRRQIRKLLNQKINKSVKAELFKKIDYTYENNNKINKNKNLYGIKNRHCRNNTTYFLQKDKNAQIEMLGQVIDHKEQPDTKLSMFT